MSRTQHTPSLPRPSTKGCPAPLLGGGTELQPAPVPVPLHASLLTHLPFCMTQGIINLRTESV